MRVLTHSVKKPFTIKILSLLLKQVKALKCWQNLTTRLMYRLGMLMAMLMSLITVEARGKVCSSIKTFPASIRCEINSNSTDDSSNSNKKCVTIKNTKKFLFTFRNTVNLTDNICLGFFFFMKKHQFL